MICKNGLFTSDQWELFNRFNIKVPIEGKKYTIRQTIKTQRGEAFLLNEIRNPLIPNENPDPEGTDFKFEPSWASWRFQEESEYMENVLQLEESY